jgi:hypothetical protein
MGASVKFSEVTEELAYFSHFNGGQIISFSQKILDFLDTFS